MPLKPRCAYLHNVIRFFTTLQFSLGSMHLKINMCCNQNLPIRYTYIVYMYMYMYIIHTHVQLTGGGDGEIGGEGTKPSEKLADLSRSERMERFPFCCE